MKKTLMSAFGMVVVGTAIANTSGAAADPYAGGTDVKNNSGTLQVLVDDKYSAGHGWCDNGEPNVAIAVRSTHGTRTVTVIEERSMTTRVVSVGEAGAVVTMPVLAGTESATAVHVFDGPRQGDTGTGDADAGFNVIPDSDCSRLPSTPPGLPASWGTAPTTPSPTSTAPVPTGPTSTTSTSPTKPASTATPTPGTTQPGHTGTTSTTSPRPSSAQPTASASGTHAAGHTDSPTSTGPKVQTDLSSANRNNDQVEILLAAGAVGAAVLAGGATLLARRQD